MSTYRCMLYWSVTSIVVQYMVWTDIASNQMYREPSIWSCCHCDATSNLTQPSHFLWKQRRLSYWPQQWLVPLELCAWLRSLFQSSLLLLVVACRHRCHWWPLLSLTTDATTNTSLSQCSVFPFLLRTESTALLDTYSGGQYCFCCYCDGSPHCCYYHRCNKVSSQLNYELTNSKRVVQLATVSTDSS